MAMQKSYNVLFLCTGNSARSIMAEAIMNQKGRPNFAAYSAGSHPSGKVRPEALRQLEAAHLPTLGFRSKSWDEFAKPGAPKLDFVFTVCDNAANEVCPVWPGQPMTAHWGVPDPAAVQGTKEQVEKAFRDAFFLLDRRIGLFLSLPLSPPPTLSEPTSPRHTGSRRLHRLPPLRSRWLVALATRLPGFAPPTRPDSSWRNSPGPWPRRPFSAGWVPAWISRAESIHASRR
jgi:arsenate reductase (thioredoxin)